MRNRIVVILINIGLGLLTAYSFLVSVRETKISTTQSNIACNIVKLDLEHTSRQHPKAYIVFLNKEYITSITPKDCDSLQLGPNHTTFFYDELLDRVFCRDPGIKKGAYMVLICFLLSFLFWFNPKTGKK